MARCPRFHAARVGVSILVLLAVVGSASAQEVTPAPLPAVTAGPAASERPFSLRVQPAAALPLIDSADVFSLGGLLGLGLEYGFGTNPQPFVSAGLDYTFLPVRDAGSSVSVVTALAGGGLTFWLTPRLALRVSGAGGGYLGFLNDGGAPSGHIAADAGAQVDYLLTPGLNLSIGASYRYALGTFQGLTLQASTSLFLRGSEQRRLAILEAHRRGTVLADARTPEKGRGIDLASIEIDEIYPVLHKVYDVQPVGRAILVNQERAAVTDVKLAFFVRQFMDSPSASSAPVTFEPEAEHTVDIMGLLADRVLEVTEPTRVAAELTLEYRMDGDLYRDTRTVTIRVLDRNAMVWDDDRKAAAFVTAKDPAVLSAAKSVAGLARERSAAALNENLVKAMGVFTAMELYGLSYVVDPKTPFVDFSKDATLVDYLQFPRQTLSFKAGDCDDLSILFAALLESVGVETAFVTVPGHIFIAFSTGLRPDEAPRAFSGTTDLIMQADQAWIPLETTVRRGGFMRAWAEGARQWRDAASRGSAGFHPIHEAWSVYEPVQLPGTVTEATLPAESTILAAFEAELARYVDREIAPRVAQLEESIRRTGGDAPSRNRLGILYAQYGRYPEAEEQLRRAVAGGDHLPSLINLGNLFLLQNQPEAALEFYERAERVAPDDPRVLLGLTQALHHSGATDRSRASYERLAAVDRQLAERHAYLGTPTDTGRASGFQTTPLILWAEESP